MGRAGEAAGEARRSLAVAREITYPAGEVLALGTICFVAESGDDFDGAVQLARQAAQITAGVSGRSVRWCSYVLTGALILTGDLAAADHVCAVGLAQSRETSDVFNRLGLLPDMVILDVHAGRLGDAAAHLREELQLGGAGGRLARGVRQPVRLRVPVCRDRTPSRGRHDLGRRGRAHAPSGDPDHSAWIRLREEPLRAARRALGPDRTRAAEERGAAMSLVTAAECALLLTAPGPEQAPARRARNSSANENANWSSWSRRATPTPRSRPSCTSASAPSARTWTGSATKPAAAAAPT